MPSLSVAKRAQQSATLGERDLNIGRLVLREYRKRSPRRIDIAGAITDGSVDRTIEGASTLTLQVSDPDWVILDSGILDRDANGELNSLEAFLDGEWYALVQVQPGDEELTLTFEDRGVFYLRKPNKPIRKKRTKSYTRALFIKSLVAEVNKIHPRAVDFYSPGVKGSPSSRPVPEPVRAQIKDWTLIGQASTFGDDPDLGVSDPGDSSARGRRAGIATYNSGRLGGWWVLRDGRGKTFAVMQVDFGPAPWTGKEFDLTPKAMKAYGYPQGNSPPGTWKGLYVGKGAAARERALELAGAIIEPGGGVSGDPSTPSGDYYFERGQNGKKEDSWTAIQRLAGEVNWRAFVDRGELVYMSEEALFSQPVAYVLNRRQSEILSFGFDWDRGKPVAEANFTVLATRWAFGPGLVVDLTGAGPANGRWIISKVSRGLFSQTAEVTLKQPTKPKKEPKPAAARRSTGSGGDGGSSPADGTLRQRIVKIAKSQIGYHEGGGKPYDPGGSSIPWCAYFATWVWRNAGVPGAPSTGRVPTVQEWAKNHGLWKTGHPVPGDFVIYATAEGPRGHMGIVVSTNPVVSVDGNYSDAVVQHGGRNITGFVSVPGG